MKKNNADKIEKENIPNHVAIIMDGNGRWAQKRRLPRSMGHREGSKNIRKIVDACYKMGIKYLTVYAFSTENWSRPKEEIDELMNLLLNYLRNFERELAGKQARIRVLGEQKGLSEEICKEIERVESKTKHMTDFNFIIAINYGGRQEIVNAVNNIIKDVKSGKIDKIDDKQFSQRLYTPDIPDPDLIIRTSGEMRISNFLIWQSSYSEFYFCDVLWPDFSEKNLREAILSYQKRQRRYGGVKC